MSNMGLSRLLPRESGELRLISRPQMATGSSANIVEGMEYYDDLQEPLGPFEYIAGDNRQNRFAQAAMTDPRRLAEELIPIAENKPGGNPFRS